jgi:hypothetical protein
MLLLRLVLLLLLLLLLQEAQQFGVLLHALQVRLLLPSSLL